MEGNFGITSLFRLEARGLKYVGGPKGNEKEKNTQPQLYLATQL